MQTININDTYLEHYSYNVVIFVKPYTTCEVAGLRLDICNNTEKNY